MKARDIDTGRFSFNVKGGRCEECRGEGVITTQSLSQLVDAGHTAILVEHHLDIIKTADHGTSSDPTAAMPEARSS